MNRLALLAAIAALVLFPTVTIYADAQDANSTCKTVHADMVETRTTSGCKVGDPFCFLGEVDGNHGLRGTTYFKGDSSTAAIGTSPDFVGYSGVFEYTTDRGTLITRETGVTGGTPRVVTAYQRITSATGEYQGATGYFFVSGHNNAGQIVTRVVGEICYP